MIIDPEIVQLLLQIVDLKVGGTDFLGEKKSQLIIHDMLVGQAG